MNKRVFLIFFIKMVAFYFLYDLFDYIRGVIRSKRCLIVYSDFKMILKFCFRFQKVKIGVIYLKMRKYEEN